MDRGVALLAPREAPEMEQKVVVAAAEVGSSEWWTLEEERREGSGRT